MDTPTIGILGGYGNVGRHVVRLLLQHTGAPLVVAGRHILRAREFARECNRQVGDERVCAAYAHPAEPGSLRHAFEGAQLLLLASPTGRFAEQTARAALDLSCDWLDVQFYTPKLEALHRLRARIEGAGRCFVTDAGFAPGLPALLVRYAATQLEAVETANVFAVLSPQGGFPKTPSLYEFARELMRCRYGAYRDGVWRFSSGLGLGEARQSEFGFGFGARTCLPLMLEEMRALPQMLPSLQETGFYIAGFNWFVDWVGAPLLYLAGKMLPTLWVRPMANLLHWTTRLLATPPFGAILRLESHGWREGRRYNLVLQLYHPDPYLFTAIAVVAGVLQYLRGEGRKTGLWFAGHLYEPVGMLHAMRQMGVQVQEQLSPIQGACPFCGR
ncbi:MAG: saccharopine dehydrogenase NADP-binding domain-containing protein [bacterium]|nr:saccharopine dehydrogenase NADP-binding domain-containing protein [bacterium]